MRLSDKGYWITCLEGKYGSSTDVRDAEYFSRSQAKFFCRGFFVGQGGGGGTQVTQVSENEYKGMMEFNGFGYVHDIRERRSVEEAEA